MIVTEKEAASKFCPFMRRWKWEVGSDYRGDDQIAAPVYEPITCRASACMAWRWVHRGRGEIQTGFCGIAGPTQ